MKKSVVVLGVTLSAAVPTYGCGDDETEEARSPETVTVREKVIERTVTEKAPSKKEPAKASTQEPSKSGDGEITVPDVVGKDHQLAQDTMQDAGLYALQEEDATGQDRLLLYDRNWTVVSQDPPAGTRVSEDATITLRSKKDDE